MSTENVNSFRPLEPLERHYHHIHHHFRHPYVIYYWPYYSEYFNLYPWSFPFPWPLPTPYIYPLVGDLATSTIIPDFSVISSDILETASDTVSDTVSGIFGRYNQEQRRLFDERHYHHHYHYEHNFNPSREDNNFCNLIELVKVSFDPSSTLGENSNANQAHCQYHHFHYPPQNNDEGANPV